MQESFNKIMEFNKLDMLIIIIAVVQLLTCFIQGYKKSIYHSVKYVLAYIITRAIYKMFMPMILVSNWYSGYKNWIDELLEGILPNSFGIITLYPVDRYILNLLLFISVLLFLRLIIIGWAPESSMFDRFAGMFVGIVKTLIITTVIVLLLTPFVEMIEPVTGNNIIEDSKLVDYMKEFNPLLNGARLEF